MVMKTSHFSWNIFVNFTYLHACNIALQPHIPYWAAIAVCKMLKELWATIASNARSWRHRRHACPALDDTTLATFIQPPTNPTLHQSTSSCRPARCSMQPPFHAPCNSWMNEWMSIAWTHAAFPNAPQPPCPRASFDVWALQGRRGQGRGGEERNNAANKTFMWGIWHAN